IVPWYDGGSSLLQPSGIALLLDPDGDPTRYDLLPGVLVLKPDDMTLGNGLRAAGDRLALIDPGGVIVDSVAWDSDSGDGVSWERQVDDSGSVSWIPSRSPTGSTPGRENSPAPSPHHPLARVISEVQPRPLEGWSEWVECSDQHMTGVTASTDTRRSVSLTEATWLGWSITIRSIASPLSGGRGAVIHDRSGQVLLVASDSTIRDPLLNQDPDSAVVPFIWSGLRIADGGSIITLTDPAGVVVDSAVIRQVDGLPRGFTWQRWRTDLPGWSPEAWGIGRSVDDVSPGRMRVVRSPEEPVEGFRFGTRHLTDGRITLWWNSPATRLKVWARLFDMTGREIALLMQGVMVEGCGDEVWDPRSGDNRVAPGIYLLTVQAHDEDSSAEWTIRQALGVRP
ncbi:hypothetical protein ACFL6T_07275, partial [Candidatus Zixiibacteriota bacterium]